MLFYNLKCPDGRTKLGQAQTFSLAIRLSNLITIPLYDYLIIRGGVCCEAEEMYFDVLLYYFYYLGDL